MTDTQQEIDSTKTGFFAGLMQWLRFRNRVLLTGVGGAMLFAAAWYFGDSDMVRWSLIPGALVAMLGLVLRMWATGWLCKNDALATQGPYAYTRNPLYLGTFLLTLGHGLMSGVPIAPILFPAALLAFYWPTMRKEEDYLRERYGAEYRAFEQEVPRFFPRLWPRRTQQVSSDGGAFHWPRVRRCYKGFFANALVISVYFVIHAVH
jgi:protein-S-isoprenylcysteine O-methyltransferase Ste14